MNIFSQAQALGVLFGVTRMKKVREHARLLLVSQNYSAAAFGVGDVPGTVNRKQALALRGPTRSRRNLHGVQGQSTIEPVLL